ncbi:MAG: hypothetical protein EXR72_20475 [Myxococcales bacterium]|nr:hypothetical protein [Myxococcales bacterium]
MLRPMTLAGLLFPLALLPAAGCDDLPEESLPFDAARSPDLMQGPDLAIASPWRPEASKTSADLLAVWGSGALDVYAVGAGGTILHSAGDGLWSPQVAGTPLGLAGVWGSAARDVYVVGEKGTILHSGGDGKWAAQPSGTAARLTALWGSGPKDLYAVGDTQVILHATGAGDWKVEFNQPGTPPFVAIWGSGPKDVWAIGREIWHSNGNGKWDPRVNSNHPTLAGVSGSGPEDVYIVGSVAGNLFNGMILHSHSHGPWNESPNHPAQLRAVWGAAADDVWAAGFTAADRGVIIHTTGNDTWALEPGVPQGQLLALWGATLGPVWAVGRKGEILVHR